jgi:hypothetical protein
MLGQSILIIFRENKMKITEKMLRALIRERLLETALSAYRGGSHAEYFGGGDPAFNMPRIEGVNVDIFRSNNDIHAPSFAVTIDVEEFPELSVKMQTFKDEEEARNFARKSMDHIKAALQRLTK